MNHPSGPNAAAAAPALATVSRRTLLQHLAAAAASLGLASVPAAPARALEAERGWHGTFTSFCDTLVPADMYTPAASELGVPRQILEAVAGSSDAERLLEAGCQWLDAECDGAFAAAPEAERTLACERMQAMPWESPPARFFALLRNTVLAEYYAQPAAWRGLALDRPPQPDGFFEALADARPA